MTDDELKTRLRHSADVLRDMLYDDLAEGCSRTVQRLDNLRAELEAAREDAERLRDALATIVSDGCDCDLCCIARDELAAIDAAQARNR